MKSYCPVCHKRLQYFDPDTKTVKGKLVHIPCQPDMNRDWEKQLQKEYEYIIKHHDSVEDYQAKTQALLKKYKIKDYYPERKED